MAHDAGKGSRPRPYSIPQEEYTSRLDAIFKKQQQENTAEPSCPVCSGTMHTTSTWTFFYCNDENCNGILRKS